MITFPLLLSLLPLCQDPVPAAAARPLDVIVLKNGEEMEGRITTEIAGYIEFELGRGAVVGLARDRIAEIRRGQGSTPGAAVASVAPSDEWFTLHDADGTAVGWLHTTVVVAEGGTVTVGEEYEFAEGAKRYQVTSQSIADKALVPVRSYFRERISEPIQAVVTLPGGGGNGAPDRIAKERIVEARCDGGKLHVVRSDNQGRQQRDYEWGDGATFPLLVQVAARAGRGATGEIPVFDPATEAMSHCRVAQPRQRTVVLGGKTQNVTEIVEAHCDAQNREWIDAGMKTLRREIAGPALVAVPGSHGGTRNLAARPPIAAALAREAGATFGLWVPNPAWQQVADLPAGQITLQCTSHDATIGLSRLDHLQPGTQVDSAADAVANWFLLLQPELRIVRRERQDIRERRCVRLVAESGGSRAQRAWLDVIPLKDAFLVLVCRAPLAAWEELAPDFAFVARTVELEPASVAPPVQGPLEQKQRRDAKAAEEPAPPATRPLPKVRIPLGG